MASASRVHASICAAACISSGICTLHGGGKVEGFCLWGQPANAGLLPGRATDCCSSPPKSLPLGSFELGFSKVAWFSCPLCLNPCRLLGIFTLFLISFSVLLLSKQIKLWTAK